MSNSSFLLSPLLVYIISKIPFDTTTQTHQHQQNKIIAKFRSWRHLFHSLRVEIISNHDGLPARLCSAAAICAWEHRDVARRIRSLRLTFCCAFWHILRCGSTPKITEQLSNVCELRAIYDKQCIEYDSIFQKMYWREKKFFSFLSAKTKNENNNNKRKSKEIVKKKNNALNATIVWCCLEKNLLSRRRRAIILENDSISLENINGIFDDEFIFWCKFKPQRHEKWLWRWRRQQLELLKVVDLVWRVLVDDEKVSSKTGYLFTSTKNVFVHNLKIN